jgi:hypothetical protein
MSDGAEVSLLGPMKSEKSFLTSFEMTGKGDTKKKRRPASVDPGEAPGMQKAQTTVWGWRKSRGKRPESEDCRYRVGWDGKDAKPKRNFIARERRER